MRGNHDGRSVASHTFIPPVYARYIRVYPMAYRYRICMRMELYGCSNCKLSICVFSLSFLIKWKINGQASCQFCVCLVEWWHLEETTRCQPLSTCSEYNLLSSLHYCTMNTLVEPMPIICTVYFVNCFILCFLLFCSLFCSEHNTFTYKSKWFK